MSEMKKRYVQAGEIAKEQIELHKKLHEEICRVILRWHDSRQKAKTMNERMAHDAPIFLG